MDLTLPVSAIDNASIFDALLLCLLFDLLRYFYTHIQSHALTQKIEHQQRKIKGIRQQADRVKEKGITTVFVEFSKLEREIIKEEKELLALEGNQKERTERCGKITTKMTHVQYVLVFVLFYFINRPLVQIGDGDSSKLLSGFFFPMSFKPVTIGGLLLPTGSVGGLAVMLASRVVVPRLFRIFGKMWEVKN